ncbi:helix-turn-helix domain-containing protein [Veillonella montpellierensis]|uniref:helix-turn-helix domain-containing protein n=1 Tax=Veillonella montpellierensis TaxID=187328 RepID=UPI0023F851BA|nr:helix-turn-helix domain-containing protein [Veillonella montpellierensis]
MTTQEAGERWDIPADSIKQCCLKRYPNKQFTHDEAIKSGKNWLVTRQGLERLYEKIK